jgi:hypothetical protein
MLVVLNFWVLLPELFSYDQKRKGKGKGKGKVIPVLT